MMKLKQIAEATDLIQRLAQLMPPEHREQFIELAMKELEYGAVLEKAIDNKRKTDGK